MINIRSMYKKNIGAGWYCLFIFLVAAACSGSNSQNEEVNRKKDAIITLIDQNLEDAVAQYKLLKKRLPEGRFPKTYYEKSDSLETSDSEWWTSGFYPGTLLYLFEATGDQELLSEATRIMEILEKEQHNATTHDLGFMMYCSFGNLQRLKPSEENSQILIQSAQSLASRYNPTVGAIRSWDFSPKDEFWVIIDNMMNLELLFWATRATGDSTYYQIAVDHANTTMEQHFRPDYSSYHVLEFETATGEIKAKRTEQGFADSSAWARGQAWGLYGYTVMYRETGEQKYLEQAQNIAEFMLHHPNMPEDLIPYWDFNDPQIPNAPRDASAAAVTASALLELSGYSNPELKEAYFNAAELIIRNLASAPYKAEVGENGGFILKHSVGHLPAHSEVDVPLTYADYYFVEAMIRYKDLKVSNPASE